MSDKIGFTRRLAALLVIAAFALLLAISLLYAQGEEEHEEEVMAADTTEAMVPVSQVAVLDSVYHTINAGFKQLEPIFRKGCYDCHTDYTEYPWYYKLPLIKGMINDDIKEAHHHVDMTNGFPFKAHDGPADQLVSIREEIKSGDMPPFAYRLMHWSAKPSDAEADSVYQWVDSSLKLLAAHGQVPREGGQDEDDEM